MEYQQLIEDRYSVREFLPDPVAQEDVLAILEAGRIAPTARNTQPQRIWVVTKPEDLAKIDECSPCRYGAPVVLVCAYDNEVALTHSDERNGDWSYGIMDGSSVFTHMMLKAHDLGLGTCWVGMFDGPKLQDAFGLEGVTVYSLLDIGHIPPTSEPNPRHFDRKPLDETVTWL